MAGNSVVVVVVVIVVVVVVVVVVSSLEGDVLVFNPFAASAVTVPQPQFYRRHEQEKRRKHEQLLQEENCSFTPLIFQHPVV